MRVANPFFRRAGRLLAAMMPLTFPIAQTALARPTFVRNRVLVKFNNGADALRIRRAVSASGCREAGVIPHTGIHILTVPPAANEMAVARAFNNRHDVEFAQVDAIHAPEQVVSPAVMTAVITSSVAITPNDTYYPNEWHLPKIGAPDAWRTTTGSASVIIAILDTGCDPTHPDLASKYVAGWNTYSNSGDTSDTYGHGTMVAGQAAACSNNGAGVASPAWGCSIMPIRVADAGGNATDSAMAAGLTWAADHGARVANLSYNVTHVNAVDTAAAYFRSKGGVVTVSSGNNTWFDSSPDDPYVLTISATDQNDVIASWSNTGNDVDLASPGVSIPSTFIGGGYGVGSGTSASAPIVAGVAALMMSANPSLSPQQIEDILKQSADDLGAQGWDPTYGYGRVNAARAVSAAVGAVAVSPPLVSFTSPASGATVSASTTVQVSATDTNGVASVSLYLDGALVATRTAAPYDFPWNSQAVANGVHALKAVAADTAGTTASAQISVTVSNTDQVCPSITITSPTGGAISGTVSVKVSAADNVGVVKVGLYADGALVGTSTAAPFTTSWNTRKVKVGPHTLQCKAWDAAGNVGSSQVVTVTR